MPGTHAGNVGVGRKALHRRSKAAGYRRKRMGRMKNVAIVLAAGRGSRMHSEIAKQYLLIKGRPVIWYALSAFERCPFIDEVVLVTGADEIEYCRTEIVEKYGFRKERQIVAGGKERYHSVYRGILAAGDCDYLYIHDGARPFVTQEILERARDAVCADRACVVGMPVKDTIKLSDGEGFCAETPDRSRVWQIQTPQVFEGALIRRAYESLMETLERGTALHVTDDAMVVEAMTETRVRLVPGDYRNIKITTPEDLCLAELFAQEECS